MAKKDDTAAQDPTVETPESEKPPLEQPNALAAGVVQVTEDEQGEQFARVADGQGLRTENMPTQAQVNAAQADAKKFHNPDDGILSASVDGVALNTVWPMMAVTHCAVGLDSYGPGQPFSVSSKEVRDTLIDQKAAVDRKLKASEDPRPDDPSRYSVDSHLTT